MIVTVIILINPINYNEKGFCYDIQVNHSRYLYNVWGLKIETICLAH